MREEKHFPKTLHIVCYCFTLCSRWQAALGGRQDQCCCPVLEVQKLRLRAPSGLLFYLFLIIRVPPTHKLGDSEV